MPSDEPNLVNWLFRLTEDGAEETDNPSLLAVRNAVSALDGDEINEVSIAVRSGASMDIGGGKGDQYVCHARAANGFWHLVDPRCDRDMSETVRIAMGDREAWNYPKCTIVTLAIVMSAVECFCASGKLCSDLTWDNALDFEL